LIILLLKLVQDGVSAAVVFGELAHFVYGSGQTLQQVQF
jgi:hypothetical protein